MLSFYDELHEQLAFFSNDGASITYLQSLDPSTKEAYNLMENSPVDLAEFEAGVKNNTFFLMANQSAISANTGKIYGSYSLPKLKREPDGSLAYYNSATFITKEAGSDKKKIISMDFDIDFQSNTFPIYVHEHALFSLLPDDNITMRCSKGYPNYGMKVDDWKGKPSDYDTRMDEYYDDAYYLHSFDINTGEPLGYIGKADDIFRKYKVGTAFANPKLSYYNNIIAYTSGTSGVVNIADYSSPNDVEHQFQVFEINDYSPTHQACTMEYLTEMYNNVFNQLIIDIIIDKKYCYLITMEKGGYYFKKFRYNGKQVSEILITADTKIVNIDFAIGNFNGTFQPFYINKLPDKNAALIYLSE